MLHPRLPSSTNKHLIHHLIQEITGEIVVSLPPMKPEETKNRSQLPALGPTQTSPKPITPRRQTNSPMIQRSKGNKLTDWACRISKEEGGGRFGTRTHLRGGGGLLCRSATSRSRLDWGFSVKMRTRRKDRRRWLGKEGRRAFLSSLGVCFFSRVWVARGVRARLACIYSDGKPSLQRYLRRCPWTIMPFRFYLLSGAD